MQSAVDLLEYFENIIADVPEPSEEEIENGIAKILERVGDKNKSQA